MFTMGLEWWRNRASMKCSIGALWMYPASWLFLHDPQLLLLHIGSSVYQCCCECLVALAGGWGCMLMCGYLCRKVMGSQDKQRALMACGGACQVWTEGVTSSCIKFAVHWLLVCSLCDSFVLSLFGHHSSSLIDNVSAQGALLHSRRLPSW